MSEQPFFDLIGGFFDEYEELESTETMRKEAKCFVASTKSKKTEIVTSQDVRKLLNFLDSEGERRPPEEIEPQRLCGYLCKFVQGLKKLNQDEYEPQTLKGIIYSIERYLKDKDYPEWKITSSPIFSLMQDVLKAKMTVSKAAGKGNRPQRTMPLTDEDEEKLWSSGAFGLHDPMALLRVLFWYFTMLFGLRGRDEHHQMLWGDVEMKSGPDGDYLEYTERLTKTRRGSDSGRPFKPKIFPIENKARCPVEAFKLYASKRPACENDCSKFYLAVNHSFMKNGKWFKNAALGQHSIGRMLSSAAKIAQIDQKKIANHSARKTAIKRLLDGGCPPSYVTQLTGHKSMSSLASYTEACDDVQRKMARTVTERASFTAQETDVTAAGRSDDYASNGTASDDAKSAPEHAQISNATLERLAHGAVIGKTFTNCTFNINFNMQST